MTSKRATYHALPQSETVTYLWYLHLYYHKSVILCTNTTDPPEFTAPSQNVTRNAAQNESFTFDCTPSAGNPAVYNYTFQKGSDVVTEGVNRSVLTINPVVRGSRGVYTCEAANIVGMATITQNLFVTGEFVYKYVA